MTEKQIHFLKKVEKYFNNQLAQIKNQGNLDIDNLLVKYHTKSVESARAKIIKDNQKRLSEIAEYKEKYTTFFNEIAKPDIKSLNSQFNIMLGMKETLANTHYSACIKRSLNVERIDLSSFKVSEYDGLI